MAVEVNRGTGLLTPFRLFIRDRRGRPAPQPLRGSSKVSELIDAGARDPEREGLVRRSLQALHKILVSHPGRDMRRVILAGPFLNEGLDIIYGFRVDVGGGGACDEGGRRTALDSE